MAMMIESEGYHPLIVLIQHLDRTSTNMEHLLKVIKRTLSSKMNVLIISTTFATDSLGRARGEPASFISFDEFAQVSPESDSSLENVLADVNLSKRAAQDLVEL